MSVNRSYAQFDGKTIRILSAIRYDYVSILPDYDGKALLTHPESGNQPKVSDPTGASKIEHDASPVSPSGTRNRLRLFFTIK